MSTCLLLSVLKQIFCSSLSVSLCVTYVVSVCVSDSASAQPRAQTSNGLFPWNISGERREEVTKDFKFHAGVPFFSRRRRRDPAKLFLPAANLSAMCLPSSPRVPSFASVCLDVCLCLFVCLSVHVCGCGCMWGLSVCVFKGVDACGFVCGGSH